MNNQPAKKAPFKIKRVTTEEYSAEDNSADNVIKAAYGAKMQPSTEKRAIRPRYQQGGEMQSLQEGGMAEGPLHEEGGIPVMQEDTGEQIAEIEGGERVFSIEDTQMMEEAAAQIQEAMTAGDRQTAEDLAMRLGFAVVNMIAQQEQNEGQQEQAPVNEDAAMQAANSFSQEPDNMQTI